MVCWLLCFGVAFGILAIYLVIRCMEEGHFAWADIPGSGYIISVVFITLGLLFSERIMDG